MRVPRARRGRYSCKRRSRMGNWRRIVGFAVLCVGVLAPAAVASALPQYVDLGDSYASGVGTRVFYNEECSRSPEAYGPKVAAARGYTLSFKACSGANPTDVNRKQLRPRGG